MAVKCTWVYAASLSVFELYQADISKYESSQSNLLIIQLHHYSDALFPDPTHNV